MKKKLTFFILSIIFLISFTKPVYADSTINWTKEEAAFLENNPVVHLGVDPKFVPFEFIDQDDNYKGIAADYLDLISDLTGLEFEVKKGLTWPEAYELAKNGELDALPAVGKTPEREELFLLSKPYYNFKRVIATKDKDTQISGMDDLEGLSVAVQRSSSHHSYLLAYQKINLSLYDSVEAALTAVSTGEEIAFIGNLATTNYLIRTNGMTNLRFVSFEAEKDQALHFAVRKDWPELVSIFNKAVAHISEKDKAEINKKWVDLQTHFDFRPIIRIILIAAGLFIVILIVSAFWISRLKQEIQRRVQIQHALENTKSAVESANSKLRVANDELAKISMVDGLTGISNRRYFDDFLKNIWGINARENFPLSLIMIDIDHFKNYNDTYGHLAGDQCLKAVARVLSRTVKRQGDFVARFGGEEFAVLLSNTFAEGAVTLAEIIRANVENEEIEIDGVATSVTVSLGVGSLITNKGITPENLIQMADAALYRAKADGRNTVVMGDPDDLNKKLQ